MKWNPLRALRAIWVEVLAAERAVALKRVNRPYRRRHEDSGRLARRVLRAAPENRWARRRLALQPELDRALALAREGRGDDARAVMHALLGRFPKEPEVHLELAPMLAVRSEFDEAAHHAHCAAELAPDDPHTVFRAAWFVRWGDPAASGRYIERVKVLIARPEWQGVFLFGSELSHLEGLLAFDEGREHDGLAHFERAFALEPQAVGLAGDLALGYLESGRPRDALDVLAQGLEHRPGDDRMLSIQDQAEAEL